MFGDKIIHFVINLVSSVHHYHNNSICVYTVLLIHCRCLCAETQHCNVSCNADLCRAKFTRHSSHSECNCYMCSQRVASLLSLCTTQFGTVSFSCIFSTVKSFILVNHESFVSITAPVLAGQAEAIVRTGQTWPQPTKRRTGD